MEKQTILFTTGYVIYAQVILYGAACVFCFTVSRSQSEVTYEDPNISY